MLGFSRAVHRQRRFSYLLAPLLLLIVLFSGLAHAQEDFLDPEDAFVFSAAMATPT